MIPPPLPPPPPPPPIRTVGLDSESHLILAGNLAPPLVCVSTAERGRRAFYSADADRWSEPWGDRGPEAFGYFATDLFLRDLAVVEWRRLLSDPLVHLAIHNGPFDAALACNEDLSLVPLVFQAYEEERIHCSIVTQKLIDVALGMRDFRRFVRNGQRVVVKSQYGLDDLVLHYFNEKVDKSEDTWRLSYALLYGRPISSWPERARRYAVHDAVLHLRLREEQVQFIADRFGVLPDQGPQQRAAFALHLMSMWGVRADTAAVDRFIDHCRVEIDKMHRDLAGTGIFREAYRCGGGTKCKHSAPDPWLRCPRCGESRCRRNPEAGSRDMAEIRRRVVEDFESRGIQVPRTAPTRGFPDGQVNTYKDTLEATTDVSLHVLAAQMTFVKHLGQWGPVCRAAVLRPVCAKYDSLKDTGRTGCSGSEGQEGTNFQNPPRQGDVRPCFKPRDGWLFGFSDADTVELRAQAQNCLEIVGFSKMAEALWDQHLHGGPDLHVRFAANLVGEDVQSLHRRKKDGDVDAVEARQFAKVPGFGLWGGMGAEGLLLYAAAMLSKEVFTRWFGTTRDEQIAKAKWIIRTWHETWSEARPFFRYVDAQVDDATGEGTVRQLLSGRIRGGARRNAIANGYFQGRVADAMKEVLWRLAIECYVGRCTSSDVVYLGPERRPHAIQHQHGGSNRCTYSGRSILMGSRPVLFLHDETIVEHPEDGTESDRVERQCEVTEESLNRWMPGVPCTAGKVLTRAWHKGAETVRDGSKIVPCKPVKVVVDGKAKVRWVPDYGVVDEERKVANG